jgi:hypothetical protein
MIPKTEEVLAQLVLLARMRAEVEPEGGVTVGGLAGDLMYPPLFIINALDLGVGKGVLEHDYETDKLSVVGELGTTHMGSEVSNLMDAIIAKVRFENGRENDLSLGLIQQWCVGVRPSAAELALRRLVLDGALTEYDYADPKDPASVYTFYTLPENKAKEWHLKQFKSEKKKDV